MADEDRTDRRAPVVRVEDARLVPEGGPACMVVSGLEQAAAIAAATANAGGSSEHVEGRLRVTIGPSRLVDAAGRVGGRALADPLREAVDRAVNGWLDRPPDIETPAGTLPCSERPIVMGILNVTPDSFSDGGQHLDPDAHPQHAIEHGLALLAAGADLVDVGGESTRPGAEPVDEEEELRRVLPVIEALADEGAIVSVDTSKASVARAAVKAGAALVNDVSAGQLDGLLLETVRELDVPYVVMHMRGTPRTMQRDPRYIDVVAEVFDFLAEHVERLLHMGLSQERLIVDPGIGFGKSPEHNVTLLRRCREFTSLGRPLLIGTSRKSFLGSLTDVDDPAERLEGSIVTAAHAVAHGAAIVRVHDVAETVRAVAVGDALRS